MKKITTWLSVIILATVLFSCEKLEIENTNEQVEYRIALNLNSNPQTKSLTSNSSKGGFTNNPSAEMRFIVEIYDAKTNNLVGRMVNSDVVGGKTSFSMSLFPGKYDFLYWADFEKPKSSRDVDNFYITKNGLKQVTYNPDPATSPEINNELRDAYCGAEKGVDVGSDSGSSVILTRPFGKVRVIAKDYDKEPSKFSPDNVIIRYNKRMLGSYSVMTGLASDKTYEWESTAKVVKEDYEKGTGTVISFDYLWADPSAISFELEATDGTKTIKREFTNIPVEKNKLTSILGNIFSTSYNTDVEIDDMLYPLPVVPTTRVSGAKNITVDDITGAITATSAGSLSGKHHVDIVGEEYESVFAKSNQAITLGEMKEEPKYDLEVNPTVEPTDPTDTIAHYMNIYLTDAEDGYHKDGDKAYRIIQEQGKYTLQEQKAGGRELLSGVEWAKVIEDYKDLHLRLNYFEYLGPLTYSNYIIRIGRSDNKTEFIFTFKSINTGI